MNRLKFAIVGCGRIAQRHAEHIHTYGVLVAVCDIIEERAVALAKKYQAASYTSIDKLLRHKGSIDVVSVCTPNGLHAVHSIAALEAGYHVLVEKPMALAVEDCRRMIDTAERMNRKLFVVKQNRFNPPVNAVKLALDKGILGKIYSIQLSCFWNRGNDYYKSSWKGTKDKDGGALFTQFSHFIDLLYWMVGDVKEIRAFTNNFAHEGVIEFEDTGVVAMVFCNGAIGTLNYTVNSFQKNMEGSITLFAEKGTIKIGGEYLNELEYQLVKDFTFSDLPEGNTANHYGTYVGSMSNHDKVYQQVIDVLQDASPVTTNALDALKTVEIITRIYAAAGQYAKN